MTRQRPPAVRCEVQRLPSGARISLTGEIDLSAANQVSMWLAELIRAHPGQPIEADLAGVRFMDSTGIRVFINAQAKAANVQGGSLYITNAHGLVRDLLQITGVYNVLCGNQPT